MTKDSRLVVRMSDDLRAWVHEQAGVREQDDAAYVRMVLAEARRGGGARIEQVRPPVTVGPYTLDPPELTIPAPAEPEPVQVQPDTAPIDIDALVAEGLATAEKNGLTEQRSSPEQEQAVQSGVRAVRRPPMPYSPRTQPGWIPS